MGFWEYVTVWYNAIFLAPLLFLFLFAALQIFGASFEFGGDADVDIDVDADVDVDVDPDLEFNADLGIFASVLGFFNVGKVPLMVILMTFCATFGITGLVVNGIMGNRVLKAVPPIAGISMGVAFVVGIFCVKFLAAGLAQILPESDPPITYRDLVGRSAIVTSGRVTAEFGRALVELPGNRLHVSCRIREGDDELVKGDEVFLDESIGGTDVFLVSRMDSMGVVEDS